MTRKIDFRFAPVPHELLFQDGVPSQVVHLWAAIYRIGDLRGGFGGGVLAIPLTELAERLGWAEKTVARWAKVGADLGWINVRRRGQGLPNEYQVVSPDRTEVSDLEVPVLPGTRTEVSDPSSTTERSKSREKETMAADAAAQAFDVFWEHHPKSRRRERVNCLAIFQKEAKKNSYVVQAIVAGHVRWLRYWKDTQTEERFITTSIVWLRLRRWEDDPTLSRQNGSGKPSSGSNRGHFAPDGDLSRGASNREGESSVW